MPAIPCHSPSPTIRLPATLPQPPSSASWVAKCPSPPGDSLSPRPSCKAKAEERAVFGVGEWTPAPPLTLALNAQPQEPPPSRALKTLANLAESHSQDWGTAPTGWRCRRQAGGLHKVWSCGNGPTSRVSAREDKPLTDPLPPSLPRGNGGGTPCSGSFCPGS